MIQPTKSEIRGWLAEARQELKEERNLRRMAEYKLRVATEKLGQMVVDGAIAIPVGRLGELVIRMEMEAAAERATRELEEAS
jgi:hypothetical protein